MPRVSKKAVAASGPAPGKRKAASARVVARVGVKKVSVSLAADDLAWAQRDARARKLSLSAVLSEALHRRRRAEALQQLLTRLGAQDIGETELSRLRGELYGARD